MLTELYYYLILPFSAVAGLAGAYYILDPSGAQRMFLGISWNVTKAYITCQDWGTRFNAFAEIDKGYESGSDDSDNEDEPIQRNIILYDGNTENNYVARDYDEEIKELLEKISPTIMFLSTKINDVTYYKRTNDPSKKDTEYDTFSDKPFVQVEYIEDDDESGALDIHQHLTGFYVNENIILDRAFLEWYLSFYFNRPVADKYSLRIFDKDVNMFNVGSDECIILKDNGYTVEKFLSVEEENYEGATNEE